MQSTQLADNQLYRSWQISVLSRESRRSVAVGVSLFQYSPQDCALIALHCLALGARSTPDNCKHEYPSNNNYTRMRATASIQPRVASSSPRNHFVHTIWSDLCRRRFARKVVNTTKNVTNKKKQSVTTANLRTVLQRSDKGIATASRRSQGFSKSQRQSDNKEKQMAEMLLTKTSVQCIFAKGRAADTHPLMHSPYTLRNGPALCSNQNSKVLLPVGGSGTISNWSLTCGFTSNSS